MQQGDVLLYQTPDGGEINVDGGLIEMTGGFETAAYLSLFGGNEDDDGSQDSPNVWWGSLDENETAKQYRSETQYLLQALEPIPNNLRRLEDAAGRDLAWFEDQNVASSVTVVASMPRLNTIKIAIEIEANGQKYRFNFVENWKVAA